MANPVPVGDLVALALATNQARRLAGAQAASDERHVGLIRPRGVAERWVVALVPVLGQKLVVTYVRGHHGVEYVRAVGRQKRPKRFA